ncbi:hypothetical protein B0G81_8493 [Paraburkholderia sp. BL6665CI2N2]|nr:hypothetical protein B0G73_13471 [Paraburkholderia sp. BL25I1N1]TDY17241.1 hypothetical protein B0G81_8493 [Paraburkholderia sp. BL6665CI2N2]
MARQIVTSKSPLSRSHSISTANRTGISLSASAPTCAWVSISGTGKRMRRIGIVALARRLAIALWRYLEYGEIPVGAILKPRDVNTVRA